MKPGYVVALTVPTWAPAFAVGLANDEVWRSSRDPAHCDDVQQKAAQTTRGQTATYSCLYRTARLMYTVTFIPDPRVTNPPATKKKTGTTRLTPPPLRPATADACRERYYRGDGTFRHPRGGMSTEGWIFMIGFRVLDVGLLVVWLVWFFRLRDDDDSDGWRRSRRRGSRARAQRRSWRWRPRPPARRFHSAPAASATTCRPRHSVPRRGSEPLPAPSPARVRRPPTPSPVHRRTS